MGGAMYGHLTGGVSEDILCFCGKVYKNQHEQTSAIYVVNTVTIMKKKKSRSTWLQFSFKAIRTMTQG